MLVKPQSIENVSEIRKYLISKNFQQVRHNASHEIWKCLDTGKLTSIVVHGRKVSINRFRAIERQIRKIKKSI